MSWAVDSTLLALSAGNRAIHAVSPGWFGAVGTVPMGRQGGLARRGGRGGLDHLAHRWSIRVDAMESLDNEWLAIVGVAPVG